MLQGMMKGSSQVDEYCKVKKMHMALGKNKCILFRTYLVGIWFSNVSKQD